MLPRRKSQVSRRRVFYIPGYDPHPPRRYRELYRSESQKQAAISDYRIEQKSDPRQRVPLFALKLVSGFFGFFEWGQNISDRLAFVEILNTENNFSKSTFELYKMFKIDSSEIIQLDDYFLEYFIRLLKRLRDINFEDVQKQKNLVI